MTRHQSATDDETDREATAYRPVWCEHEECSRIGLPVRMEPVTLPCPVLCNRHARDFMGVSS
jgi:hypothetical protein